MYKCRERAYLFLFYFFSVLSSCPVEKGYTLNVSVDICFKLFQLELSIPDANQRCTEEGGRLLRIANLEQSNAVASHLGSSKIPTSSKKTTAT